MSKSNIMNDDDSDTYYCNKCNKRVALISKTMHDIRCKGDTNISSPLTTSSSSSSAAAAAAATTQSSQIPVATARHHIMTSSLGGGTTPIIPAQELKSVKSLSTPTTTPTPTPTTTTDYIACPVCTFHNQYDSITCECCDTDLNRNQFNSTHSSSNSLDNHVDNNDNNNDINDDDEYWSCPDCTFNNPIDVNTCDMCNHGKRPADMRRPDDIINDRLIRDDDDDDDDEFCIRSYPSESSSSSSIHPLTASALGAIGGIMLARLQNRPMSTGALQGAAYGAMGGMLLNELNSRMDDDIRHQTSSNSNIQNHDHFFTSFQQNNNALFMAFNELLESNDNDNETVSNERMQAINNLPTHIYNEDNNNGACNICLEPFKNGDGVKSLPCCHTYHTSCIDTWLSRKSECPLCKFSIS